MALTAAVVGGRVRSVPEAIRRMQRIDGALDEEDGISRFNRLYLRVTTDVGLQLKRRTFFQDNAFLRALDVNFANLYLDALRAWTRGQSEAVPRPWKVLFEWRDRDGVAAVQFAAAGVNAHINHDLPLALLATWNDPRLGRPGRGNTQRFDYDKVTEIFDGLYDDFRDALLPPMLVRFDKGQIARALDATSHFVVRESRDTAWWAGKSIDLVRNRPERMSDLVKAIESYTSLSAHLLLEPVL